MEGSESCNKIACLFVTDTEKCTLISIQVIFFSLFQYFQGHLILLFTFPYLGNVPLVIFFDEIIQKIDSIRILLCRLKELVILCFKEIVLGEICALMMVWQELFNKWKMSLTGVFGIYNTDRDYSLSLDGLKTLTCHHTCCVLFYE